MISYSVYPLGRMAWSLGNGVVIMLEDITRRKEMEDQVSDARKRLLAVFDGITDGIQVVDGDFRITAVNKSMTIAAEPGNPTRGEMLRELHAGRQENAMIVRLKRRSGPGCRHPP